MLFAFFITSFWLGLNVGVAFLATLAKFKAPSISRATALDVGRVTFRWLHYVELALFISLGVYLALVLQMQHLFIWLLIIGLGAVLAIQMLLLKPQLDKRVERVLRGQTLDPSNTHIIYGIFELSLLGLLGIISYLFAHQALL